MGAKPLKLVELSNLLDAGFSNFLADQKAVAVAVSGGPDSMALTKLLSLWAVKKNIRVHALTVDHGLRPESASEAKRVAKSLAGMEGVTHAVLRWKGRKPKTRIMEEARRVRYELLAGYCAGKKIKNLFLAHHQDDQAETFLLRLAAGSGLDGLAGMKAIQPYFSSTHSLPPSRGGIKGGGETLILLRPLLTISKAQLIAACKHYKVPFVKDPTNNSERFARPRLRKLWAVLEAEGLSSKRLAVTAARLGRAQKSLDEIAEKYFRDCILSKNPKRIVLNNNEFKVLAEEVRFRVLQKAIRALRPKADYLPRMEKIEALFADLSRPGPFRKRTLGGLIFERDERKGFLSVSVEK